MEKLIINAEIRDARAMENLTALRQFGKVNLTELIEDFFKNLKITESKTLKLVA